jgi:hypothetical protein
MNNKHMRRNYIVTSLLVLFLTVLCFWPFWSADAQSPDRLTLSITPPLVKNKVQPGQVWKSSVKLINNNNTPITVYIRVVDFQGRAENGTVQFLSEAEIEQVGRDFLLSEWIALEKKEVEIGPQTSEKIPFIIEVPEDAEPGGHYAAILAGTQPPDDRLEGATIQVSSLLASLLLVSVEGETVEAGRIREFSTPNRVYTSPQADFTVRFENTGNVHIQPQGEIRIYDQWNEEQGIITINHRTEFGNVLPGGTRKWEFSWKGERNFFSMGRYRADLVLGYGDEARQTENRSLYFWVIYAKPLLIGGGVFLAFILFLIFFIRLYIRRAIARTQAQMAELVKSQPVQEAEKPRKKVKVAEEKKDAEQVLNLRHSGSEDAKAEPGSVSSRAGGVSWRALRTFLLAGFLLAVVLGAVLTVRYYEWWPEPSGDSQPARELSPNQVASMPGNATSSSPGSSAPVATSTQSNIPDRQPFLDILNGSGQGGVAGEAEELIREAGGYKIDRVGNAANFDYATTTVYLADKIWQEAGKRLGQILSVQPVLETASGTGRDMIVILGSDFE